MSRCTSDQKDTTRLKASSGFASNVESVINELAAQVEMEQTRSRLASKRLANVLCKYEIVSDGMLFSRRAKWLAQQYGVPVNRIYDLRKKVRENL